jgi:hypothetical protein
MQMALSGNSISAELLFNISQSVQSMSTIIGGGSIGVNDQLCDWRKHIYEWGSSQLLYNLIVLGYHIIKMK